MLVEQKLRGALEYSKKLSALRIKRYHVYQPSIHMHISYMYVEFTISIQSPQSSTVTIIIGYYELSTRM